MSENTLVTANCKHYFCVCEPPSSKFRIYVCKTPILCQILGKLIEIKSPEQAWFSGVVDIPINYYKLLSYNGATRYDGAVLFKITLVATMDKI